VLDRHGERRINVDVTIDRRRLGCDVGRAFDCFFTAAGGSERCRGDERDEREGRVSLRFNLLMSWSVDRAIGFRYRR
jgi:hypothetical protein